MQQLDQLKVTSLMENRKSRTTTIASDLQNCESVEGKAEVYVQLQNALSYQ